MSLSGFELSVHSELHEHTLLRSNEDTASGQKQIRQALYRFLKNFSSIQFYLVPSHNSSCLKCVILNSTLGTVPAVLERAPAEPGRRQLSAGWELRGKQMREETIGRQDKT